MGMGKDNLIKLKLFNQSWIRMLPSCPGDEPRGLGPDPRRVPGQHCWSPAPDPAHQASDHEHDQ